MYTNPYLNQGAYSTPNPYMSPYQRLQSLQQNTNNILWVQGIEGAKAFQLPPSSSVVLLDSDSDNVFYIKTSDNVGMCNLRTFQYSEVITSKKPQENVDLSSYVRKEELRDMILEIFANEAPKEVKNEPVVPANTSTNEASASKSGIILPN